MSSRAPSSRAATSAIGNCTPWNRAIAPPNACRSVAYRTARSTAARAMPQAWAAIVMRPPSSVARAILSPSSTTPTRSSPGTSRPSSTSSAVEEVCRPSFGISFDDDRPSRRSTRNAETPFGPGAPVRANMMKKSAKPPLVIQVLVPSMRHPSPTGRGARADRGGVGAGVGLGQRVRAEQLAGREPRQVLSPSARRCRIAAAVRRRARRGRRRRPTGRRRTAPAPRPAASARCSRGRRRRTPRG